jgi:two-component system response regulator HydG
MAYSGHDRPVSVLVVDDEELIARTCGQILTAEGYEVFREGRGRTALSAVRRHRPDIVLTDLMLPDLNGLDLLREITRIAPGTVILVTTGFATVDSSVEATQAGAHDYLVKPFTATQLRIAIGNASEQVRHARDGEAPPAEPAANAIVGTSEAIRKVLGRVARVAPTEASVFLSGQSGTGKELVARAIHSSSRRGQRPFVAINCAAMPDQLLESELFGHQKGAFTGADSQRRGLLEAAAGGTFFLDEVSEMSLELQAKLLRVIQERKIRRVGGEVEIPIDVRWVSATNRDPEEAVRAGILREDLFFRLNVIPIRLPALRERREDIPALAEHFLDRFAELYARPRLTLPPGADQMLRDHDWPGNVRELQNVVERMVSLSDDGGIGLEELAEQLGPGRSRSPRRIQGVVVADRPFHVAKAEAISAFEKAYLRDLLVQHHGNISRAARDAGIDRKTIHRMLIKYELDAIG